MLLQMLVLPSVQLPRRNNLHGENEGNEDYGNQEFDGNVVEEEIGTQE